jgi:hypothetical protein
VDPTNVRREVGGPLSGTTTRVDSLVRVVRYTGKATAEKTNREINPIRTELKRNDLDDASERGIAV